MRIDAIGSPSDDEKNLEKLSAVSAYFSPALNERIKRVNDPSLRNEISSFVVDIEEKGKKLL